MRQKLSLPRFPFPFAFDQWKKSVTGEGESYRRLRDLVHVTLITCRVFVNGQSGRKKKHSTVMVQLQQNQWETTKGNGAPEKNITIPSFGKSNHRRSLSNGNCDVEAFRSYGVKELKCFSSCLVQWSWQRPCCIRCMGKSILRCSNYMNDMQWHLSSSSSAQHQTLRSWSMMWEVFAW